RSRRRASWRPRLLKESVSFRSRRSGGCKGLRPGTDAQNALTLPLMHEHRELLPDPLPPEPLEVVARWLDEAWAARVQPNANSMVLATSRRDGRPSARVVLCKEIAPTPGYVVFYTNYLSSKGRHLQDNPRAAAVMHWDALHRQVRIEGEIVPAPASDSDAYFASRPGAHATLPVAGSEGRNAVGGGRRRGPAPHAHPAAPRRAPPPQRRPP